MKETKKQMEDLSKAKEEKSKTEKSQTTGREKRKALEVKTRNRNETTTEFKAICMTIRAAGSKVHLLINKSSISWYIRMAAPSSVRFLHEKAYVNGKWADAASGKTFDVVNPSNGKKIGVVPDMDAADTQNAIQFAQTAFESWKETTAKERSVILRKWSELCIENKDELAKLLTLENGKPLAEATGEVMYGTSFMEWFAEEGRRVYGDIIPSPAKTKKILVLKQPIGVAGMITPWNFPNAMITRKACAAIAAGCTVVLKPAEDTPYSALALCELAEKAGLPPGVLNIVTCSRANAGVVGKMLCESPMVKKISFTGSTVVGKVVSILIPVYCSDFTVQGVPYKVFL
ncbi:ALDH5A1 [Mytilus coruscus]|uniref:ALDH5A1 n=1 Tax=Mytilus coruscus TaxID=42192 RepID=A0A6J8EU63_MYTCO|nr:ALDH5A1 [Mytilus coruscus]